MVKIKQNDTEQIIAVPSEVPVGTKGWDTSIKKSTNGVENRAFTLARNNLLSDNQYNTYTAHSLNNALSGMVDNDYTPLQKGDILNNVSIPDSNVADNLHILNAREAGLTKPYTAESPVTISNNVISDRNGFEYPSMYLPDVDNNDAAHLTTVREVCGYRNAHLNGTEISPDDFESDYIGQTTYTGIISTINVSLIFSKGSSGTYLTFTQGDLDYEVEPFTGRLCVMRHGHLMNIDTYYLPQAGSNSCITYNGSGDYIGDVWNAYAQTSNGESTVSKGILTTSTLPVDIMLLPDGHWLLLPNQVIATGNLYDSSTGNTYGAFTLFSDLSWIGNWWWKPTKNPSDNLVYSRSRIFYGTDLPYNCVTQSPFGQTTSHQVAYGSGGSFFCEEYRKINTTRSSSQLGLWTFIDSNYTWCANSYTRGYFVQARSI